MLQQTPPSLHIWPDRALYLGPSFDAARHAHHAVQICVGLDAAFRLHSGGHSRRWRAAIVSSDVAHALDARGTRIAALYLERDSQTTAPWREHRAASGWKPAGAENCAQAAALGAGMLAQVQTPASTAGMPDSRIVATLALLQARRGARLPARELAAAVGLSPHRFMHLFRAATGLPLRRYALWLRLRQVVGASLRGANLTEAAHAAGFADSAHLSRTFRRMFGLPPSFLLDARAGAGIRLCAELPA